MNTRREQIFAQAARKLRSEFEELSVVPHNAVKGHEVEEIVRRFLTDHLPKRFAVGSGFILDPLGEISRQTDVILYDAFNCPVYRASEEASIFPSNNVATVIEVKSTLDKNELNDAWGKISAIKAMSKSKPPDRGPMTSQTTGILFAFDSKISLTKLTEHYRDLFRNKGLGHHIDSVVILDKGILTLAAKLPGVEGWNTAFFEGLGGVHGEGTHICVSAGQFEEYTLDAFFRLLLPQLTMFRHIVDHPGFEFNNMPIRNKKQMLSYLTSVTRETDPAKREQRLREYAQQVEREFSGSEDPDSWER